MPNEEYIRLLEQAVQLLHEENRQLRFRLALVTTAAKAALQLLEQPNETD
ncbi:MAG: hypothetical protein IJ347_09395 [Faecalibacterium sp.]|nr:hypothetical protein [Faecalibacterium sp.]